MSRASAKNGSTFEAAITRTLEAYRVYGVCDVEKVEPPIKTFGTPQNRKVIFLENPFLDFIGSWTEMAGKLLVIECKSTETDTLSIGGIPVKAGRRTVTAAKGITQAQIDAGHRWHRAGAAVCYLWHYRGEVRLTTPHMLTVQLRTRRSLRWCDAHPVPQGRGFIIYDFLALLRPIHKPNNTITEPA